MSTAPGYFSWADLTVQDAESLRSFYTALLGMESMAVNMNGYSDFCLIRPEDGHPVAGICHARGQNSTLPNVWLLYFPVGDLDRCLAQLTELGGSLIAGPQSAGGIRYAVVKDPAGACFALYEQEQKPE
ncbi:MAG: VOC family protein [Saprospiraceae bacterium]|nr:VOC family protein [Saprospiraceae bacterium]